MLLPRLWTPLSLLAVSLGALAQEEQAEIKSIPLRTHSLHAPYLDSDMQSRWFDFGGDTVIRTDQYIRLTVDKPSRSGWIWSRVPLTATNWEIEVEFKVHGTGSLYGDGFAMWLTKQRAQEGPVFGSIDKWDGLGIFFDTYKNGRPGVVFPLVMAAVNDGTKSYDKAQDGKDVETAGCSARGMRNQNNFATKARITYFQDKSLVLELQYKSEGEWTKCFEIPNAKIPSVAYLGFSAETGELSDNHDIISVQTKNLYSPSQSRVGQQGKPATMLKATKMKKEGGSWSWFFLKFVLFGLAITGAYVGFTVYRTSKRSSRF